MPPLLTPRTSPTSRHTRYTCPRQSAGVLVLLVACAVFAAALVGCAPVPGIGASLPSNGTPVATHATHGGGLAVKPCAGPIIDGHTTQAAIILTQRQERQTIQAQVGDVIEVRLPANYRWDGISGQLGSTLAMRQPQGSLDNSLGACVWDFAAVQRGEVLLQFTGGALCASDAPCPMYAIIAEFTLRIS
ncbi:MAG: hypothetical protein ABI068_00400 [Ktedonobacterales bacterium]